MFEIETTDPLAYLGASAVLLAMAAAASWIPARRTARVAPAEVLNEE